MILNDEILALMYAQAKHELSLSKVGDLMGEDWVKAHAISTVSETVACMIRDQLEAAPH